MRTVALISICLFLIQPFQIRGQDLSSVREQRIHFKPQFFQIKDALNYGLTYSGINLNGGYHWQQTSSDHRVSYATDLAFGVNFNKGIGLAWHFKPLDLFYGFKMKISESLDPIYVGPYLATHYQVQLYPYLQSGHMFWFTTIEYGPRVETQIQIGDRSIFFRLTNSLAGWTARPKPATETYFYSLRFSDFIQNPNSRFNFGSFEVFNHTNLTLEMNPRPGKRLSVGYEFDYVGIFYDPNLHYIAHSFNLTWKIGKK